MAHKIAYFRHSFYYSSLVLSRQTECFGSLSFLMRPRERLASTTFAMSNISLNISGDCRRFGNMSKEESKNTVYHEEEKEAKMRLGEFVASVDVVLAHKSSGLSLVAVVERDVRALCDAYLVIKERDRDEHLTQALWALATRTIDRQAAVAMAAKYIEAVDVNDDVNDESDDKMSRFLGMEARLQALLEPNYIWVLRRVGQIEGGVKFLVDVRADLIRVLNASTNLHEAASLRALDAQMRALLTHWFSVGFLELSLVTWDSPCSLLQKISDYEAVHPMRDWTDLKARVGPFRRCFAYMHRSMPGEPVVVLHVALTRGIPERIASVVKHCRVVKRFSIDNKKNNNNNNDNNNEEVVMGEGKEACDSAIFYSISSTQTGLKGIELGTHLIRDAVVRLKDELPHLVHFSTLSPIPGFRSWLLQSLNNVDIDVRGLRHTFNCGKENVLKELANCIRSNTWLESKELADCVEPLLMRLCARYLYLEKRRNFALDPVANFHLRNGALLYRLNWLADASPRGLQSSCAIMVNYKYDLEMLEDNSANYQMKHKIAIGEPFRKWIHPKSN